MNVHFAAMLPLLFAASPVQINPSPPMTMDAKAQAASLDDTARREVVAKFSRALREVYVFPDVGEQVATRVDAALAAGQYETLTSPYALAERLSADAAAIAHDKHLTVRSAIGRSTLKVSTATPRAEAGITRADKLAGGIGYIEVVGFPPAQFSKRAVDSAMSSLAGSRALIIDIRRNGGGDPQAVSYLVSFLVQPDQPINDIVSRVEKTKTFAVESFRSVATPVSFADVPVYVLTSKNTFSGGEEFAYDLQVLKRATLIGEVTGGGANPTGPINLGHGIIAMIPNGRAENPLTKTNWEGRGVQPDLVVPADEALRVALGRVGQMPVSDIAAASHQQVFAPRKTPLPGSEVALRKLIAGYMSGEPDYSTMTPEFANSARDQLAQSRTKFAPLGVLRSVEFNGPDDLGGDEYRLNFANGERKMALVVDKDGKIVLASSLAPIRE